MTRFSAPWIDSAIIRPGSRRLLCEGGNSLASQAGTPLPLVARQGGAVCLCLPVLHTVPEVLSLPSGAFAPPELSGVKRARADEIGGAQELRLPRAGSGIPESRREHHHPHVPVDRAGCRRTPEPRRAPRRRRRRLGLTLCTVAVKLLFLAPLMIATLASLFRFWCMIVLATKGPSPCIRSAPANVVRRLIRAEL